MLLARLALAVVAALALGARPAAAAVYPANFCVSTKQKAAASYCRRAFRAWGAWEQGQSDRKRDGALGQAAEKAAAHWAAADERALSGGTNCAETTLSWTEARSRVDAAVAAVAAVVNTGLDLNRRRHGRCGARLLEAAARQCGQLLEAESQHIRALVTDADGAQREQMQLGASLAFSRTWSRLVGGRCPTVADRADVARRVDAIRGDVVRNTTVSPNVSDTEFTTISPTGTTAYLGRDLQPVCMDGSPYHFFVKRGTVNKLLMYYQGGGACWDPLTCGIPVCDKNVEPEGGDNPNSRHQGFADRDNPANPFRDWNVVFVSYCSCDVHFGDAAQDYTPALHVEHRGYHNARVAEKWAREHFLDPEVVFVTGSSAGAYGAWFNAPLLHQVWPASRIHVLADAGNGVITKAFLDDFFPNWNFEGNLPPDFPALHDVLEQGTGIPGYTEVVANLFPRTTWSHYASAYDGGQGGQASFYNIMLHENQAAYGALWWDGMCPFNAKMREQVAATFAAVPANYRYYIGAGWLHTMWGSNKVYDDTTGGVPTIVSWINAMLNSRPGAPDPAWTNVECASCGTRVAGDPDPPVPPPPPFQLDGTNLVVSCPPG